MSIGELLSNSMQGRSPDDQARQRRKMMQAMGDAARGGGRQTSSQRRGNIMLAGAGAAAEGLGGTDWQGAQSRALGDISSLRSALDGRMTRSARNQVLGQGMGMLGGNEGQEQQQAQIGGVPVATGLRKRYEQAQQMRLERQVGDSLAAEKTYDTYGSPGQMAADQVGVASPAVPSPMRLGTVQQGGATPPPSTGVQKTVGPNGETSYGSLSANPAKRHKLTGEDAWLG